MNMKANLSTGFVWTMKPLSGNCLVMTGREYNAGGAAGSDQQMMGSPGIATFNFKKVDGAPKCNEDMVFAWTRGQVTEWDTVKTTTVNVLVQ